MASSTSKEISFRWWSFLQSVKEEGDLDGFGFPKARDGLDTTGFEETWSDPSSTQSSGNVKNPHWFFDVEDKGMEDSKEKAWSKEDDEMLDKLLNACGMNDVDDDEDDALGIPSLQWSYSFEEPSWEFTKKEVDSAAADSQQDTFFSQEFRWDEAKFFDMEEAFTATSTESGSDFTGEFLYEDDLSTLTPVTGIHSIESIASEENCWYRAKIASLFTPRKRAVMKLKQDDLEVWPKKQVPSSHSTAAETPLLSQVPPEELARRISIMQERQAKQAEIQELALSPDPELRKDAEDQLKELWITAYKKRSRDSGLETFSHVC